MEFEEFWGDLLGIKIGPFRMGASFGPVRVRYTRSEEFHIVKLKLDKDVKKEEIKVRFISPGVIEIEWPRKEKGEEIPVE